MKKLSRNMLSRRDVLHAASAGVGLATFADVLAAQAPKLDAVSARIQADLQKHASFGIKKSGTPGDLATADWVAGRLKTAGYKVQSLDFDAPYLVERAVKLTSGGKSVGVFAQTPAAVTGPKGVTARLQLIRAKSEGGRVTYEPDAASTEGKIAFLVLQSARHAAFGRGTAGLGGEVFALARAGAVGAVLVTTGPSGEAAMLNTPEDVTMPIPTVILAPNKSADFVQAAMEGAEATLLIDADQTRRNSKNVIGRIERGDQWLAISTPRSGWFHCVAERGTGQSIFLELAEWVVERYPKHSVFVMATGGHEFYFSGSHRVMEKEPPPAKQTALWTHIGATMAARDAQGPDGNLKMLDTADPSRSTMATDSMMAAVAEGFKGIPELARARAVRTDAGELSTFTDKGYEKCFAVIGQHRWFHTIADTIETTDARLVTPVLEAHKRTMEIGIGA